MRAALPSVSVVVPVYNGEEVLPRSVPAVLAMEGVTEIFYVDDGSTDGTAEVLARHAASDNRVRVLTHAENRSRAAARNTGVREATGDIVFFLDADVRPAPGAALAHARLYLDPNVVGAISKPVLEGLDPSDPFHRYLRDGRLSQAALRPGVPLRPFVFTVGYTSVRREALERIGAFDEDVPYGEDLDLGFRLEKHYPGGLRLADEAPVYHSDHGSMQERLDKLRRTGRDAFPLLLERSPGFAQAIGWGFVDSSDRSVRSRVKRLALCRAGDAVATWLLPFVPPPFQHRLIQYRSAYALLSGYQNRSTP